VKNVFLDDEPDFLDELEESRSADWVERTLARMSKWHALVPDSVKKKNAIPSKKIELRRKF
jgi:hypothetical protein